MIIYIDPVALYIHLPLIGWWPIHWYGITWLMAIFGILWYSKKIVTKKTPFDKNDLKEAQYKVFVPKYDINPIYPYKFIFWFSIITFGAFLGILFVICQDIIFRRNQ